MKMRKLMALLLVGVFFMMMLTGCDKLPGFKKEVPVVELASEATDASEVVEVEWATESVEVEEVIVAESELPFDGEMELMFSSGAGGWWTNLTLSNDGTFYGDYHDSDMGDSGKEYPNGTVYVCEFKGYFSNIEKIDKNTYVMKLDELYVAHHDSEEWIEDGIRYVKAGPYGFDNGMDGNFIFYLPQTPVENLSEDFINWWPGRFYPGDEPPETLESYGIYNVNGGYGFFS